MTNGVMVWWAVLCTAAALNMGAWAVSAVMLNRRKLSITDDIHTTRPWPLWLAAVYVLGCAFRSVLPMVDAPRICVMETWASRIAIGRSIATVAELCFIIQWALLMREAGRHAGLAYAGWVSRTIVALIVA